MIIVFIDYKGNQKITFFSYFCGIIAIAMKKLSKILLCAAAIAAGATARADRLVLLHTNDTHSQIDPVAADDLGGVARRKVLIDSVRAVNDNVLLIDAGDVVQGSLFFNIYKGELEEKLMNALGYDLRILGNHEFDNGMEALARNLSDAGVTLLASNYQTRGSALDGIFRPFEIKEYDGRRIAFIAINLQPKGMISEGNYDGLGYIDAITAADRLAWVLKNVYQADYVVAVTHIGYDAVEGPSDIDLARNTRDIDLIIGGHTHTLIDPADAQAPQHVFDNADGRPVAVAQTGRSGKYLGEITIDLDNLQAIPATGVIRVDSRLDSRTDPAIEAIIAPYRHSVDSLNSVAVAKVGRTMERDDEGLLNYVTDFVALRGRELHGDIDLAIFNRGSLRNTVPAGTLTKGQVITLVPFFNHIQVAGIKGSDLAGAFDVMARGGGNGVSSEVDITYDPATGRCTDIRIGGKPLDPDATYIVALPDYLANGGDYMFSLRNHDLLTQSPNLLYEDLLEYLGSTAAGKKGKKLPTINPAPVARMHPVKK